VSALPRGICGTCGRVVALRRGGFTREHVTPGGRKCGGSGKPSEGKTKIASREVWLVFDALGQPYLAFPSRREALGSVAWRNVKGRDVGGRVAGPYVLAERRREK
jgi:hypothetical protein